jgi:hypothetical protein
LDLNSGRTAAVQVIALSLISKNTSWAVGIVAPGIGTTVYTLI